MIRYTGSISVAKGARINNRPLLDGYRHSVVLFIRMDGVDINPTAPEGIQLRNGDSFFFDAKNLAMLKTCPAPMNTHEVIIHLEEEKK